MLRLVSFCVLAEAVCGRKATRKGGGDKPPVSVDRIELPDSCAEGLVAIGATVFVWGG